MKSGSAHCNLDCAEEEDEKEKKVTEVLLRSSQAVEADDIAQELLERAGPRTEETVADGDQQRGPYVVAPEEMFDGSMKDGGLLSVDDPCLSIFKALGFFMPEHLYLFDMDLPVWQGVVTRWQQRIQAAERYADRRVSTT
eukprot:s2332_g2.t1